MYDHDDDRQDEQLCGSEKIVAYMLIAVSALWGILLWKIGGWLVLWIKEVLKCF